MRRGLMGWDPAEVPEAALAERRGRLQREAERRGLEGLILYSNFVRPSAVCYVTAFTPYWSEGLLLVPREGDPVLATAMSKRVTGWIRSVNPVGEIVHSPRPGTILGERLAARPGTGRIGVVELDTLPAGLADDLEAAAPGIELVDGTQAFATVRNAVDAAELGLLDRAARIAAAALESLSPEAGTAGEAIARAEGAARLAGAEECYLAIAPDLEADRRLVRLSGDHPLGGRFAVRASVAYKGAWVRRTRTLDRATAPDGSGDPAGGWLEQTARGLDLRAPLAAQLAQAASALPGARLDGWAVETTVGSHPLQVVASSAPDDPGTMPPAPFAVLTATLEIDGRPWLGAVPILPLRAA